MKTFKERLNDNHPEVIEEINKSKGLTGLLSIGALAAGSLFSPYAKGAEKPSVPESRPAASAPQQGNPNVEVKNGFIYATGVAPDIEVAEVKAATNMNKFLNGEIVSRDGNKISKESTGKIPPFKVFSTKVVDGKYEIII